MKMSPTKIAYDLLSLIVAKVTVYQRETCKPGSASVHNKNATHYVTRICVDHNNIIA